MTSVVMTPTSGELQSAFPNTQFTCWLLGLCEGVCGMEMDGLGGLARGQGWPSTTVPL